MEHITCDNNCASCGKYTSVSGTGGKYLEFSCHVARKDVKVIYDENSDEEILEVDAWDEWGIKTIYPT